MVRSIWKRALVTTFAWAGLAWAQQPITTSGPATKPVQSAGQYFTVQESGKVGQKCKVLKSWRTPEGKTAYQVQALNTGEMMTIVESGPATSPPAYQAGNGSHVQAVPTRIFHWGSNRMPPAGTPMPPIEYVQTMPPTKPSSEPAKTASAAYPEAAKPAATAQSEPTKQPAVGRPEPAKTSWFPWATQAQAPQTKTALPPQNISGAAPATQPRTTVQNNTTTTLPGSAPPLGYVQTMPLTKPSSEPAKTASAAYPEAAKLAATAQPEPTKQPATAGPEPAKTSWFPWATQSRAPETNMGLPPQKIPGLAPATPPRTTVQNYTTTTLPGSAPPLGYVPTMPPAKPGSEPAKTASAAYPEAAVGRPEPAKTSWFPWVTQSQAPQTKTALPSQNISSPAAATQPRTTVQNYTTTTLPGSAPPLGYVPSMPPAKPGSQPAETASAAYPEAAVGRPEPAKTSWFPWATQSQAPQTLPGFAPPLGYVQTMPSAKPGSEPAKTASAAYPEAAKPAAAARPEPTKQPVTARPEPAKTSWFPWATQSQAPQTKTALPPENISGPGPVTQPRTTGQNNTTSSVPGSANPRVAEARVQAPAQTSIPQNNTFSSTSVSQSKTITPDSRFGSTPATFQDTSMTQSRATVQDKPSNTADKLSSTPVPRTPASSPYFPTSPAVGSSATPQSAIAPQRAVQVVPPSSAGTSPASTTNSAAPVAPAPKSTLLNRQAVPVAPAANAIVPAASEKKPVDGAMISSGQPTKPVPAPRPAMSTPSSVKAVPALPSTTWPAPAVQLPAPPLYKPSVSSVTTTPYPSGNPASANATAPSPATSTPSSVKAVPTLPSAAWPAPAAQPPAPPLYKPSVSSLTTTPSPSGSPTSANATAPKPPVTNGQSLSGLPPSNDQGRSGTMPMKGVDATKPATTTMAPSTGTTANKPAPVTAAPPTDWRKSWGKMDDGNVQTTDKPAQSSTDSKPPPAKPALPQADSKRPDPLQIPQQFDRRPADEKPSAQKRDTMLLPAAAAAPSPTAKPAVATPAEPAKAQPTAGSMPAPLGAQSVIQAGAEPLQMSQQFDRRRIDDKPSAQKRDTMLLPAAAAASTPTAKPVVATLAEPAKAQPPAGNIPVPLGAQSVIQAGDPGPGGVRYIPVPMVTIPDVRRAPVPPMTTPAQVYSTSGVVPAASGATMANAFTPAPSRPAFTQTTNAFGPMAPTVPAASYGQSIPAPGPTGMSAQAKHAAGSDNPANPTVISAGFQGPALTNQTVAAAYHTTAYEALPPCPPLTAVKPTPESIQQMVSALRDSFYPSQREWAAENMAAVDWRTHPQVVQALTTAAKEDPAATVRAGCVRCLANMKVDTMPVVTVVRGLKNDSDPRVRQEAERAFSILAAGEK